MKIIEKDFKIEHDNSCYVLYFLRTKKELKENLEDPKSFEDFFKIQGYYSDLNNAIKVALKWRMDPKYSFKESYVKFYNDYLHYKKSMKELDYYSKLIYSPIYELEKKMYNEHKEFCNR